MNLDRELLDILACPDCKSSLRVDDPASELVCTNVECLRAYPVRDDIPVLLIEESRKPGERTGGAGSDNASSGASGSGGTGSGGAGGGGSAGSARPETNGESAP